MAQWSHEYIFSPPSSSLMLLASPSNVKHYCSFSAFASILIMAGFVQKMRNYRLKNLIHLAGWEGGRCDRNCWWLGWRWRVYSGRGSGGEGIIAGDLWLFPMKNVNHGYNIASWLSFLLSRRLRRSLFRLRLRMCLGESVRWVYLGENHNSSAFPLIWRRNFSKSIH